MTTEQKARLVVFDIETYRTNDDQRIEAITQAAIDAEPDKKLVSPETLAAIVADARDFNKKISAIKALEDAWNDDVVVAERIERALDLTALDPLAAHIVAFSANVDGTVHTWVETHIGEMAGHLVEIAETLDAVAGPDTIWIGHNIQGFDLKILLNNWRRHEIAPPAHFPGYRGRYWSGRVFDTMDRVPSANGLGYVSLDDASRAYGLQPAKSVTWRGKPMDGSRVAVAYTEGEHELIKEYVEADVEAELALYMAITFGDTRDTFDRDPQLDADLARILAQADVPEQTREAAAFRHLVNVGRIRVPA